MIGSKGFEREQMIQNLWQKDAWEDNKEIWKERCCENSKEKIEPWKKEGTPNNPCRQAGMDRR